MHMIAISLVQVFVSLQLLECINNPPTNRYFVPKLITGFIVTSAGFPIDAYRNYQDIGFRLIVNAAVWLIGLALFVYYQRLKRDGDSLGGSAALLVRCILWGVYLLAGVWFIDLMIKSI